MKSERFLVLLYKLSVKFFLWKNFIVVSKTNQRKNFTKLCTVRCYSLMLSFSLHMFHLCFLSVYFLYFFSVCLSVHSKSRTNNSLWFVNKIQRKTVIWWNGCGDKSQVQTWKVFAAWFAKSMRKFYEGVNRAFGLTSHTQTNRVPSPLTKSSANQESIQDSAQSQPKTLPKTAGKPNINKKASALRKATNKI